MIATESGAQTHFVTARDGTRLAYDVTGSGPAVILLHGGGQTRRVWHDAGYVSRLARDFTVITVDLRGNGESDKPTSAGAYGADTFVSDLLDVADAAKARRFSIVGFSYGANVGRYAAVRSDRVRSMVYVGIPFGAAASGVFRQMILDIRTKWTPIIEAQARGTLTLDSLAPADRAQWERGNMPVGVAWLSALLDYPPVEPAAMKAPTLWLVGTENRGAMESVSEYRDKLKGTRVSVELLQGLNHPQELERIDVTFPLLHAFLARTAK